MDRLLHPRVFGEEDEGTLGEESRVQSRQGVLSIIRAAGEMRLHQLPAVVDRLAEPSHQHSPGKSPQGRMLFRIPSVDEDELVTDPLAQTERLEGLRHNRRGSGRLERRSTERCEAGEPPLLVISPGKAALGKALHGSLPEWMHPGVSDSRQSLEPGELLEVGAPPPAG